MYRFYHRKKEKWIGRVSLFYGMWNYRRTVVVDTFPLESESEFELTTMLQGSTLAATL